MYKVRKTLEISAAHHLALPYASKCSNLHGHNWRITIHCRADELNEAGMVVDFARIKQLIEEQLDHKCLNDVLPFNPTAENIAHWVCGQIPQCYLAEVEESDGNVASYEKDED
jgi:6-pyruvoyltetrahydropterin/6-carboxytetrahydropterin synthase